MLCCPVHEGIELYKDMTKTRGYCDICRKWYNIAGLKEWDDVEFECDNCGSKENPKVIMRYTRAYPGGRGHDSIHLACIICLTVCSSGVC